MNKDKTFQDFLPDRNTSFKKNFNISKISKQISKEQIIDRIKTVKDPEIPVNLYDLGLIYNIFVDEKNNINIEMTLTNPNCPVAGSMPKSVGEAVLDLKQISSIKVSLI